MRNNWIIDEKIKEKYIEKCKLFVEDDMAFANFKRDIDYGMILEGNQHEIGEIAISYLQQRNGWRFFQDNEKKFKENDLIGNPIIFDEWGISSSTLRYINTSWEIKNLLGEFKPKRILEIGGGYGGLCKTLNVIYDFEEYTNKDIPEVETLFIKYTSRFKELNDKINTKISGEYDLFIADSSLSECDEKTQLYYGELAKNCEYIYLTYNTIHKLGNKITFQKLKNLFKEFKITKTPGIETERGLQSFSNTYLIRKKL